MEPHAFDLSSAAMGQLCASYMAFCDSLRGSRPCPRRADFDIVELAAFDARLVPHLWVLEIEPSSRRYRYRVVGEALIEAGAKVRPGSYVDDFAKSGDLSKRLDAATAGKRPNWRRGTPFLRHFREVSELEVLLMPFTDASGNVTSFINCTVYHWHPGYG